MWKQPMSIYAVKIAQKCLKPLIQAEMWKSHFRRRPLKLLIQAEMWKSHFRISPLTRPLKLLIQAEMWKSHTIYIKTLKT